MQEHFRRGRWPFAGAFLRLAQGRFERRRPEQRCRELRPWPDGDLRMTVPGVLRFAPRSAGALLRFVSSPVRGLCVCEASVLRFTAELLFQSDDVQIVGHVHAAPEGLTRFLRIAFLAQ